MEHKVARLLIHANEVEGQAAALDRCDIADLLVGVEHVFYYLVGLAQHLLVVLSDRGDLNVCWCTTFLFYGVLDILDFVDALLELFVRF